MVNANENVPSALLTAQEAADLLAVPHTWVLAEARSGRLPHIRLGRYVRFQRAALEGWLSEQAHVPIAGSAP